MWGGEHVLYHHPSGKTHLLNEGSALLLRCVLITPKDVAAAARELAELQGGLLDERFVGHVTGLIMRFDELGLVEPVPT